MLLLYVKKCTEIWECVAQKKKRLIAKEPHLRAEGTFQPKVVKCYKGGECHEKRVSSMARSGMALGKKEMPS